MFVLPYSTSDLILLVWRNLTKQLTPSSWFWGICMVYCWLWQNTLKVIRTTLYTSLMNSSSYAKVLHNFDKHELEELTYSNLGTLFVDLMLQHKRRQMMIRAIKLSSSKLSCHDTVHAVFRSWLSSGQCKNF